MYYSNREIYNSYMNAKNRTEQIKILAQLNLCSREKIAAVILEEFEHRKQNGGFLDAGKEREAERAVKQIKIKTKTETKELYVGAATYGSLPLELRQHIYQRVCENCTYEEFLKLTELPDARTTRIAYQNLKQRALREGFSVTHHPFCDVQKTGAALR